MLILEGPDGIGKTTAAKRIVELAASHAEDAIEHGKPVVARPVHYAHMTRQNAAFDFLYDYQDLMSLHAVQDRFHLGALVYHEDVMSCHSLRIVEGWLGSLGSYTIVMYADGDNYYRRLQEENKKYEMFDKSARMKANRAYTSIAKGEHPFKPSIDAIWSANARNPWPDDETLQCWLREWFDRLSHVGRRIVVA